MAPGFTTVGIVCFAMLPPALWFIAVRFHVTQARYRKEQAPTQLVPWIPPVDNLLKDSTDGSVLGALLHFYCPQLLPLGGEESQTGQK